MLEAIVRTALARRWLVLGATLVAAGVGAYSFASSRSTRCRTSRTCRCRSTPRRRATRRSRSEQRITFPIETALGGLPRLEYTRSLSRYGLSQVTVVFEDGTDIYFARQLVNERLREAHVAPARGRRARSSARSRRASARSSCSPSSREPGATKPTAAVRPDRPAHAPGLGDQAAAAHRARASPR